MTSLLKTLPTSAPCFRSEFHDFGISPSTLSTAQRNANAEQLIQRFFAGNMRRESLEYETVARYVNPGASFEQRFELEWEIADGGFGPMLEAPSLKVENAFRDYALTDLGAVAVARLLRWDNQFVDKGWRMKSGELSQQGIRAYGAGHWRPFRVASNGNGSDTVTPSGVLMLPDTFVDDYYSTGDLAHRFAIIHHELKAHVLPIKEGAGLKPGPKMEMICVRLESEMLREISLPQRELNWGKDGGGSDRTLHVASRCHYQGLVRHEQNGRLMEVDPASNTVKAPAQLCQVF